jgi:hypothetical protein
MTTIHAVGWTIIISVLGVMAVIGVTLAICEHFDDKEYEKLRGDLLSARDEIIDLSKDLAICEHQLKAYKESDMQSQVNEMAKIVEEHSGRDFQTSRDIAMALHSKGYRLTEDEEE